ncbi:MAG: class I SAM-dependent methyltransferase [Clostridiales bacterium]|nr:class I SAM-dependent methyltransferase [Clostridiales bacterium]
MAIGWIDPNEYSFNSFLLMERFQIRLFVEGEGWDEDKTAWRRNFGIALRHNPVVLWYLERRCPECADLLRALAAGTPEVSAVEVRQAEVWALTAVEDFVVHTAPEVMSTHCDYIRNWDAFRLPEMADFADKLVLDVGSGSGRLSFAAAALAKEVYAVEPVGTLREFMRDRIAREDIRNIRVTEGLVTALPYPDDSFDIVMSGHVVGDDWDAELAELTRVCKPGGLLLDCPGDERGAGARPELIARGFEELRYDGNCGYPVCRYRKQVEK